MDYITTISVVCRYPTRIQISRRLRPRLVGACIGRKGIWEPFVPNNAKQSAFGDAVRDRALVESKRWGLAAKFQLKLTLLERLELTA